MITNSRIDKVLAVDLVRHVAEHLSLKTRICQQDDEYSLLLHRWPYVIEIRDALVENYLQITLASVEELKMISGGFAVQCCLDIGLLRIAELRERQLTIQVPKELFLSSEREKMSNLTSEMEALDLLLPLVDAKGFSALDDGTLHPAISPQQHTVRLPLHICDRYLSCIQLKP